MTPDSKPSCMAAAVASALRVWGVNDPILIFALTYGIQRRRAVKYPGLCTESGNDRNRDSSASCRQTWCYDVVLMVKADYSSCIYLNVPLIPNTGWIETITIWYGTLTLVLVAIPNNIGTFGNHVNPEHATTTTEVDWSQAPQCLASVLEPLMATTICVLLARKSILAHLNSCHMALSKCFESQMKMKFRWICDGTAANASTTVPMPSPPMA